MTERQLREMGKVLRLVRTSREMTLKDVGQRAGRSYQYAQNLEAGTRGYTMTADPAFAEWIAVGYGIRLSQVRALIARAEILSACEAIGVPEERMPLVWDAIAGLLRGSGVEIALSLDELLDWPRAART